MGNHKSKCLGEKDIQDYVTQIFTQCGATSILGCVVIFSFFVVISGSNWRAEKPNS
jgi:hypothetical protein